MNTIMNIPKSALFLELSWEPVYTFMNRQRVAYYTHFPNLEGPTEDGNQTEPPWDTDGLKTECHKASPKLNLLKFPCILIDSLLKLEDAKYLYS
jgi:hypothetical protein